MFWQVQAAAHQVSKIDEILTRDDYKLEDVLNEDDLIQECKTCNIRLVKYLSKPSTVARLLQFIIDDSLCATFKAANTEPQDERKAFKYPYLACEIFLCDNEDILNTLVHGSTPTTEEDEVQIDNEKYPTLLQYFLSFLEMEAPLPSLAAGYFSKVFGMVLQKRTNDVMKLLQDNESSGTRPRYLEDFVKHIGTSAIVADVLLKMVGADEHMAMFNSHALNWLGRTPLVDLLTQRLSSEYDVSEGTNAAVVLQAIAKAPPTGLASNLKSPATVHKLMAMAAEAATNAKSTDHICFPFQVCIALIDLSDNSSSLGFDMEGMGLSYQGAMFGTMGLMTDEKEDNERVFLQAQAKVQTESLIQEFLRYVDMMEELLRQNRTVDSRLETPFCPLEPPLGRARLKLIQLIATLLSTGEQNVCTAVLGDSNIMKICLELFFKYPFNNMLHHNVQSMVTCILEKGSQSDIEKLLLNQCNLVNHLIEGSHRQNVYMDPRGNAILASTAVNAAKIQASVGPVSSESEDSRYQSKRSVGFRAGFQGHITAMGNAILKISQKRPDVSIAISEAGRAWDAWVKSELMTRNRIEDVHSWSCGRPDVVDDCFADGFEQAGMEDNRREDSLNEIIVGDGTALLLNSEEDSDTMHLSEDKDLTEMYDHDSNEENYTMESSCSYDQGSSKFLENMKCPEDSIEEANDGMETSMSKLTLGGSDDHDDVLLGDNADNTESPPPQPIDEFHLYNSSTFWKPSYNFLSAEELQELDV